MLSKPRVCGLCLDPTVSDGKGEALTLGECQRPKRPEWRLSFWGEFVSESYCSQCLGVMLGSLAYPGGPHLSGAFLGA